jgi:Kef-type K+ transport system membrane component KefB
MNVYYVTAIWVGMALLASVVSIKIAVPAALVEIVVGALAGNIPGIQQHVTSTDLVTFLASAGSLVPAYVAGLVVAGVFLHDRVLMDRLRSIAFAVLTPFFFLRAGTLISAPALVAGAWPCSLRDSVTKAAALPARD